MKYKILKIRGLVTSNLGSSIIKVLSGTTFAQAIPLLISPILTRIYKPAEFGLFAIFYMVSTFAGTVATGRYEMAISLPNSDNEADQLATVSYLMSFASGAVLMFIMIILHEPILSMLKLREIGNLIYLIPISVSLTGMSQTLLYTLNRRRKFNQISGMKLVQSFSISLLCIPLAFVVSANGLILAHVLGQMVTLAVYHQKNFKLSFKGVEVPAILKLVSRYKDFPFFNAPAALLDKGATLLPVLFISRTFNESITGQYGLVERSVNSPISLISFAVSQVLFERVSSNYRSKVPFYYIIKSAFFFLVFCGVPIFGLLFFFGEELFSWIFGNEWALSGQLAEILSIALLMRFVASPLSIVFVATNQLKKLIIWQTGYFVSTLCVLIFFFHENSLQKGIVSLVVNEVILYLIYLFLVLSTSKAKSNNQ